MAGQVRVRELARDQELGIIKKNLVLPGGLSFETPQRAMTLAQDNTLTIANEIPRQIDGATIDSLESGTSTLVRDIRSRFLSDTLNLTIFDLKFDSVPARSAVSTISQYLYAASDKVVLLPTVKSGLLKDPPKFSRFSERRIGSYVGMMSQIIGEIESVGNRKAIIATVPLMPIKFCRQLLEAYFSKGIEAFCIDAGTKDILLNEADFRLILTEINKHRSLREVFVYACNLGYPQFESHRTRADDFLGIFAYVDVLGGTFKTRGGPRMPEIPRRAKIFSRDEYAYRISTYQEASQQLGFKASHWNLRNYNQQLQTLEADHVRTLIGQQPIKPYIQNKTAVDTVSISRLESIAKCMAAT
jgi:hypothetical protein